MRPLGGANAALLGYSQGFFSMKMIFRARRIRIRWKASHEAPRQQTTTALPAHQRLSRNLALAMSSLLAPCALLAFTITCWCIAASLRWTSAFFLSRGMFSHWQSWLAASLILFLASRALGQHIEEGGEEY